MELQLATLADWPEIERIYRLGIQTKNATFTSEAEIPTDGISASDGIGLPINIPPSMARRLRISQKAVISSALSIRKGAGKPLLDDQKAGNASLL